MGKCFLYKNDLNNAGKLELVTLAHDWGFNVGLAQVMNFSKDEKKFENVAIKNWPTEKLKNSHHYLHAVTAIDLNNDGLKDLVGQISYIDQNYVIRPNAFVLLNRGHFFEFHNIQKFINFSEKLISGLDVIGDELFFFTYNREVIVVRP